MVETMITLKKRTVFAVSILSLFLFTSVHTAFSADNTWVDPTTKMEFVWVEGGCYKMGDDFGDGWRREKPLHDVCVDGFYIGKFEVTQGQYEAVTGDNPSDNASIFTNTDDYPVTQVSWQDVQEFIKKLNTSSSTYYRLPTEAEWEFAARERGKKMRYAGGDQLNEFGWYRLNSDESYDPDKWNQKDEDGNVVDYFTTEEYREKAENSLVHKVGTKKPNSIGIYDMSGNVWEWCNDWYDAEYYEDSPKENPTGPEDGDTRVLRGGSWYSVSWDARCSVRFKYEPLFKNSSLGFRLVLPGPKR